MRLNLTLLADRYAICRLARDANIPEWACRAAFFSVTRTPNELSLVCSEKEIPLNAPCETGWRMLRVEGPLDFGLTGIVSSLTLPLAREMIPVFVLSTYQTDYLLVRDKTLAHAVAALESAGFGFENSNGGFTVSCGV
jgi:uncharacterized protein